MNRFPKTSVAVFLLAALLCLTLVGCSKGDTTMPNLSTTPTSDSSTLATTPRPTQQTPTPVEEDCVLLGTWSVSAVKSTMTYITFKQNGTATLDFAGGSLGGYFTLTGDDQVKITASDSSIEGTYTIEGDTVTITSANDTLVLKKLQ